MSQSDKGRRVRAQAEAFCASLKGRALEPGEQAQLVELLRQVVLDTKAELERQQQAVAG